VNSWRAASVQEQIRKVLEQAQIPIADDPFAAWASAKRAIGLILQTESKRLAVQKASMTEKLQAEIAKVTCASIAFQQKSAEFEDAMAKLAELQQQLEKMAEERYRWAAKRARVKHVAEGEKYTRYFLSLAIARGQKGTIKALIDPQGIPTQTPKGKLKVGERFYAQLYENKLSGPEAAHRLLSAVPHHSLLSDDQQALLSNHFSETEISHVINQRLGTGKAPGPDGLPSEFYHQFAAETSPILTFLFNYALEHPYSWPHSFSESQICLLYKKGDPTSLSNYRPIALLDTDYKILAAAINLRIRPFATQLLSPTQTGFIPGRQITDCIHVVDLSIQFLNSQQEAGAIIFLDQEKAYDRVSHEWLLQCLLHWRFPDNMATLIHALNASAHTRLLIDGFRSRLIPQHSGVRQGCPLSPILYNLTLEPLNCYLRSTALSGIEGFTIGSERLTNIHYADDSTLFIPKGEEHLFAKAIELYEQASGARLNTSKGAILPVGQRTWNEAAIKGSLPTKFAGIPIIPKGKQERYLGVPIPALPGKQLEQEWERRHANIAKIISQWSARHTTIQGRVAVVNSLLFTKIYYHLASRYISKSATGKLFAQPAHRFIWKQRKFHPPTQSLMPPRSEGGWNLMDIQARVIALRIKTVGTILGRSDHIALLIKSILSSLLHKNSPSFAAVIAANDPNYLRNSRLPIFWKQATQDFLQHINVFTPQSLDDWPIESMMEERIQRFHKFPIWNQGSLGTLGITPLSGLEWSRTHIVRDILMHTEQDLAQRRRHLGGDKIWTIWGRIQEWALSLGLPRPVLWDDLTLGFHSQEVCIGPTLKWSPASMPCPQTCPQKIDKLTAPTAYAVTRLNYPRSTVPSIWRQLPEPQQPSDEHWTAALRFITSTPIPPQLQESRWRICMGQVPSNAVRHHWNPEVDPICPRCLSIEETPQHLIWECPHAQVAWNWGSQIVYRWPGIPNHAITRMEALWSLNHSADHPDLTRTIVIATIGLWIWRTRWRAPEEGLTNAPATHATLTAEIINTLATFEEAARSQKPKWRPNLHGPLRDQSGAWLPLEAAIRHIQAPP
jgi:hypothetical protein